VCEVFWIRVKECCHITLSLGGSFDTCWEEVAVSVMTQYNLICLRLTPTQLIVATLNGTFIFCYIDFKQKTNDAQNSQFYRKRRVKLFIPLVYGGFCCWTISMEYWFSPLKHCMGVQQWKYNVKLLEMIMEEKLCINHILYLNIISVLCRSEMMCKLVTFMAN
jgi:hypothetical protein